MILYDDLIPYNVTNHYSKKKFYIHSDYPKHIFINFEDCYGEEEIWIDVNDWHKQNTPKHKFIVITNLLCALGQIPKIYDNIIENTNFVTQEKISGKTLYDMAINTGKYGIFRKGLESSIDWLKKLNLFNHQLLYDRKYEKKAIIHEMNNFINSIPYNILNDNIIDELKCEFAITSYKICNNMGTCHRDFQSANLIFDGQKTYILDYQDLCYGPRFYDIASLLYDLKIYISDIERNLLLKKYFDEINDEVEEEILLNAIIRLCKSLSLRYNKLQKNKNIDKIISEINSGHLLLKLIRKKLKYNNLTNLLYDIINKINKNLDNNKLSTIILAAGRGKRMNSEYPKVLIPCLELPLIDYCLRQSILINSNNIYVVVGYKKNNVILEINNSMKYNCKFISQDEQLGTGHAVKCTIPELIKNDDNMVLVMAGDVPVISIKNLNDFITSFKNNTEYKAGILTTNTNKPYGCGRILRNYNNEMVGTIEEKDIPNGREDLKNITEISTGIIIFKKNVLKWGLNYINNDNAQEEYYLPDVINLLLNNNEKILAFCCNDIATIHGANDKLQLAEIEKWMNN